MKFKINFLIIALLASISAFGQLDAKSSQELQAKKLKAKANNTVFWMYDTLYKQGEPYCLLKNKLQSDNGNEYLVQSLKGDELIYVIEPSDIKKMIGSITGEVNIEFSFIKERQKLNVPKKSVTTLSNYIVEQNLVVDDASNMAAAKKLLFIYNDENPQGYTANINADSVAKVADPAPVKVLPQDTTKYIPVARNKKAALVVEDYIIRQDGMIIARYDKSSRTDGGADTRTVYIFKSPDWKEIARATNGGLGSLTWEIEIKGVSKRETLRTSGLPKKWIKQVAEFLVTNNYM